MTTNRFKYGSNERWECVLIDILEKKEYDFYEVGELCDRLWKQTQRFEKHNNDLTEKNEKLKKQIHYLKIVCRNELDDKTLKQVMGSLGDME